MWQLQPGTSFCPLPMPSSIEMQLRDVLASVIGHISAEMTVAAGVIT